jgi:hypothetical protein
MVLINCTISGNHADGGDGNTSFTGKAVGGGVFAARRVSSGTNVVAELINCTLTNNESNAGYFANTQGPAEAGGLGADGGQTQLRNTLIAANRTIGSPNTIVSPDVLTGYGNGSIKSLGHNFISRLDGSPASTWTATDNTGTVSTPADPRLDPAGLQANGGATLTQGLLADSSAINAGDDVVLTSFPNLTTDQRGYPRKIGAHVDVGAFEFDPPQTGSTLLVTKTAEHNDGTCGTADCTLLEALIAANANADASTINFKAGLSGTITNTLLPGSLPISAPLTINGPGARLLAISGNNQKSIFFINNGPVIISGLTIRNGRYIAPNGANGTPGDQGVSANSGAIFVHDTGNLTLTDCTIKDNFARGGNGGFANGSGGTARGGGIYNTGNLTLNRCTLSGNVAQGGSGSSDSNSSASGGLGGTALGGGIYSAGTLTLTNCTFSGNRAKGGAGGSDSNGSFPGNGGPGSGGALYSAIDLIITNCTFSGNAALGGFGGSAGFEQGDPGDGSGGGLFRNSTLGGTATVRNTIIAKNSASTSGANLAGSLDTSDHNLINGDPKLGSLTNNGGPTDTMALMSDSVAINTGNSAISPAIDQRGRLRSGISDIGAFEFGPASKVKPDALIHTSAETVFIGNNIYNLDGTNQTKSLTVQPGSTATYLLKIQNDGNVIDSLQVQGTAGGSGWTVQYFDVVTGRNITADVTGSSGWWILDLAVGGSKILRLKVTPAATNAGGSMKNVLVTAASLSDATKKDVVKATTTVASG